MAHWKARVDFLLSVIEYFFGFYKTRHISLSMQTTVLRAVVLAQYRHVTDGQTDGIAIASTELANASIAARCKMI